MEQKGGQRTDAQLKRRQRQLWLQWLGSDKSGALLASSGERLLVPSMFHASSNTCIGQ